MSQVVSDVLEVFAERMAGDDRVTDECAESLLAELSRERVPSAEEILRIIRQVVVDVDQ